MMSFFFFLIQNCRLFGRFCAAFKQKIDEYLNKKCNETKERKMDEEGNVE